MSLDSLGYEAWRAQPLAPTGWRAQLELRFEAGAERTVLRRALHEGPLRVQRPFYPTPDGCCHVYLLHPPGGVVGGDELHLRVAVECGARALVTTPGATKLYRSRGPTSHITQRLTIAAGARLDWLPQETIAFSGTRTTIDTLVELETSAAFAGWEILCLGRPAAGETFSEGELSQRLEIRRAGRPLFCERLHVLGGSPFLGSAWGMRQNPVVGTLVIVGAERGLVARVRNELSDLFFPGDTEELALTGSDSRCSHASAARATPGGELSRPADESDWACELCSWRDGIARGSIAVAGTELEGAAVFRFLGASARVAQAILSEVLSVARRSDPAGALSIPRVWRT